MKLCKLLILTLLLFLLGGCSLYEGTYVSVEPHQKQSDSTHAEAIPADNYTQLVDALEEIVESGQPTGVINITNYNFDVAERNMSTAIRLIQEVFPIGAYAVEEITYEIGTNTGRPAIAVEIEYRHSYIEIQKIQKVRTMDDAIRAVGESLREFSTALVMQIDDYKETDFIQTVQQFAAKHPELVIEVPQVVANVYGGSISKVVELTFTYQNDRDALRMMQSQVEPVFNSAVLYVSGEGAARQKYEQLYGFLMERFDYTVETSITPSYSLLRHGVGDSRAFAQVYSSMCRQAGLECQTVTGTRNGEPWTWNIIKSDENYYHVDLLRCHSIGGFMEFTDADMVGYVWDYSAHPATYPGAPKTQEPAIPEDTASLSDG